MGTNTQERGTLVLPSAAVVPLRNALVAAVNKQRQDCLDLAAKVHAHLKSEAGLADRKTLSKLLRGKPVPAHHYGPEGFVAELAGRLAPVAPRSSYGFENSNTEEDFRRNHEVARLLITPRTQDGMPRKVQAPKKKDLPLLLQSKTWRFSNEDCYIAIDSKTRTLYWAVPENKNAVERAWESTLGRTLNAELRKVKWTRGTGGTFNYTDEHAQDAAMEHGGNAISISSSFGPLGEREKEDHYAIPRRRSRVR